MLDGVIVDIPYAVNVQSEEHLLNSMFMHHYCHRHCCYIDARDVYGPSATGRPL